MLRAGAAKSAKGAGYWVQHRQSQCWGRHVGCRGGKVSKGGGILGAAAAKPVLGAAYWVQGRQSQ